RGDDARPPGAEGGAARRLRGLGRPPRRVPRRHRRPVRVSKPFAQLIEDGGASAGGGVGGHPSEFFRGAHFLAAEGATHTLRIETEGAELLAPLIVRPIGDGPDLDAVSPYGYPGFSVVGDGAVGDGWLDPAEVDFRRTGLVSVFLRHRLDLVPLSGATERNVVQIADPALKAK